jgi:hypothetical protein
VSGARRSNAYAVHLEAAERDVTPDDSVTVRMAPAGGCVARLQHESSHGGGPEFHDLDHEQRLMAGYWGLPLAKAL